MQHDAARLKGTSFEEMPVDQPMRPAARREIARNPSTDQKRQRRQQMRKSATAANGWEPGHVSCGSCGYKGHPVLGDTGRACRNCNSYSVSNVKAPDAPASQSPAYPNNSRYLHQGDYAKRAAKDPNAHLDEQCPGCGGPRNGRNPEGTCNSCMPEVRRAQDRSDESTWNPKKAATTSRYASKQAAVYSPGHVRCPSCKDGQDDANLPYENGYETGEAYHCSLCDDEGQVTPAVARMGPHDSHVQWHSADEEDGCARCKRNHEKATQWLADGKPGRKDQPAPTRYNASKQAARQDFGPHVAPDHPNWAPHDEGTAFGLDDQPTNCPHCGSRTDFEHDPTGSPEGKDSTKNTCRGCHFRFNGDWDDYSEDEDEGDDTHGDDGYTDSSTHHGVRRKRATVLDTRAEMLNPGDQIRTPQGKTQKVNRIRPHETSAKHVYVDTDGGTALVERGASFQVSPNNSQQQSLPGYGTPGGNSNRLPFDPQTSGDNTAPTTKCPNCSGPGTLARQGDHYSCSRCGYREKFGGAGGQAFSDNPSVVKTFSTINSTIHSAVARRAMALLNQSEETP